MQRCRSRTASSACHNEAFDLRNANTSTEARLDIKASGFWQWSQTAFFDIRVTHVNSSSQNQKPTAQIFREHEMAKKREYNQRVIDVEHGAFTPLVFGTNGGMGTECQMFVKQLSTTLAEKTGEHMLTSLHGFGPVSPQRFLNRQSHVSGDHKFLSGRGKRMMRTSVS